MAEYNERGQEIPDPNPIEIPAGARRPLNLHEQIKAYIRRELSDRVQEDGYETFEESDDFDVDEDPEWLSPYEVQDLAPEGFDGPDPDGPEKRPAKGPKTAQEATEPEVKGEVAIDAENAAKGV